MILIVPGVLITKNIYKDSNNDFVGIMLSAIMFCFWIIMGYRMGSGL